MNGKGRLASALLSIPRMRARAIISMLPLALERERKRELMESAFYENIRLIGENTGGGRGGFIRASYSEVVDLLAPDRKKEKTGEEIVADILARLGG